jgi:two-component sensor histidine kinase
MSLLRRSLMLVGLALLPAVAIEASNEWTARSSRAAEVREDMLRNAQLAAGDLDRLFEGIRQLLFALSQVASVREAELNSCTDLFRMVTRQDPKYLNVATADLDGNGLCSAVPVLGGRSVVDRPYFQAITRNRFIIGEYAISTVMSLPVLQLAQPLRRDGAVSGVIWVALRLDRLQEYLEQRGTRPGASVVVADRNGIILASVGTAGNRIGERLPKRFLTLTREAKPGTAQLSGLDGIPSIVGYVPIGAGPVQDVFVAVGIDEETAFAAVDQATVRGIALISVGVLLSILAAVFGSRRFLEQPVNGMLQAANRWSHGDYDACVTVSTADTEFDRLGRAFNSMAAAVAARERDLVAARNLAEEQAAELRQALADKQVLFNEIHHRVKNNLQVISSLLRLHSRRVDPASRTVLQQSIARIQAMSLVHELLYRMDEPSRIDFGHYLGLLCDSLREAYAVEPDRVRIVVDAAPCWVDLETATPLALLAGELIANAFKHAFPDGRSGCIHVALEGKDRCERLIVRDDGVGIAPEALQRSTGLGLTLVATLARQLGAEVETSGEGGGTTTIVTLPDIAP